MNKQVSPAIIAVQCIYCSISFVHPQNQELSNQHPLETR